MKTILRALALLVSLGLVSAGFAGTVDFPVSTGQTVYLSLSGNEDADIQLVNTDTSATVATFTLLNDADGNYTSSYSGGGYWSASGISLSLGGSSTISGLPAGNYELTTSSYQYVTEDAYFEDGSGQIDDVSEIDNGANNYLISVD